MPSWMGKIANPYLYKEAKSKTELFNLCCHDHFDMSTYEAYFAGELTNHYLTEEELTANLKELETLAINL